VKVRESHEDSEEPLEVDLGEIESKDLERARFIRGYLKANA
jgi:hypothetical protein